MRVALCEPVTPMDPPATEASMATTDTGRPSMRAVPQMWPSAGATRSALKGLSRVGPARPPNSRKVPASQSAATRSRHVMRPAARARSTARGRPSSEAARRASATRANSASDVGR